MMTSEVEIRAGKADDLTVFAALMFKEPSAEVLGLSPSVDGARRFRSALFALTGERSGWDAFLVAEKQGKVVGFAETGASEPHFKDIAKAALEAFGPVGSLRGAWLSWPRTRVDHEPPAGALHLVELQVDPAERNQGIGGRLVQAVVDEARRGGYPQLSLTTASSNPAIHLYLRHGFRLTATRTNRAFERRTGAPGRVLMVRDLP